MDTSGIGLLSAQGLAPALVTADLSLGCLLDLLPPAFPVAAAKRAAAKVGKQESQSIGPCDLVASVETCVQSREISNSPAARQAHESIDSDEVDEPDGAFGHVQKVLNVLRISGSLAGRSVPAPNEDIGGLEVPMR